MQFEGQDKLTPNMLDENTYHCSFYKAQMNFSIGKLSQAPNQSKVEYVDDELRMAQLLGDPKLDVKSCSLVTGNFIQVKYEQAEGVVRDNRRTQMCVNASVTAMARIELDRAL